MRHAIEVERVDTPRGPKYSATCTRCYRTGPSKGSEEAAVIPIRLEECPGGAPKPASAR